MNAEEVELQPIDLNFPLLKEVGAKWLVEMSDYSMYISDNPQFIVNGCLCWYFRSYTDSTADKDDNDLIYLKVQKLMIKLVMIKLAINKWNVEAIQFV